MSARGLMLVLSSPSGAGKSTLARALLAQDGGIESSVSCTTRSPRPSEVDGVHYRFVDGVAFETMRASGGFLEWAHVHGNLYGTPRAPVEAALSAGRDVVFDIDWKGTEQLYAAVPRSEILSVFVLPPSAEELHARLNRRAEDAEDVILRRLSNAREEIRRWEGYDHVLVNEGFDETFGALKGILAEARRRRRAGCPAPARPPRPAWLPSLVSRIDDGLEAITASVRPAGPGRSAA